MTLVFWALVAVVAYTYVGYPLTVAIAGLMLDRQVSKGAVTPRMTVIIAAFNEAEEIEARLSNVLASRYPPDRLDVVVASDGSTDETVAIASRVDPARVQVLDLARRGKAAALADGVGRATGEILVFTDANTMFESDAVAMLARNFADPDVGGVAGRTEYVVADEAESAGRGEDLYWRYDTWLKSLETRTGSVVSAHGGMYAIRRNLFRPVEDPAVTDDFAISTAVVEQGKRLVFERDAVGRERTMVASGPEFQRRVRLMTRGLTGVILRRHLLNPFHYGFYAIALGSRKLLRRLIPLAFPPLALVTLLLGRTSTFFAALATASVAFVVLAIFGWALRSIQLGKNPLFYVPFFFCLANLASIVAIGNVSRGSRIERWTPQRHSPARPVPAGPPAAVEAGAP